MTRGWEGAPPESSDPWTGRSVRRRNGRTPTCMRSQFGTLANHSLHAGKWQSREGRRPRQESCGLRFQTCWTFRRAGALRPEAAAKVDASVPARRGCQIVDSLANYSSSRAHEAVNADECERATGPKSAPPLSSCPILLRCPRARHPKKFHFEEQEHYGRAPKQRQAYVANKPRSNQLSCEDCGANSRHGRAGRDNVSRRLRTTGSGHGPKNCACGENAGTQHYHSIHDLIL
jgi:hypothetical protein